MKACHEAHYIEKDIMGDIRNNEANKDTITKINQ
jgi:hypothetical protein